MVVKSAVDIDADKNFQQELTDLNVDCATTDNKDAWWCKAVTSMLVDGEVRLFINYTIKVNNYTCRRRLHPGMRHRGVPDFTHLCVFGHLWNFVGKTSKHYKPYLLCLLIGSIHLSLNY